MKSEGWASRVILILVLCIAGVSAYDWKVGLLGLAVGIAASFIESRFVRLPMGEIVYMLVGTAAGVVLGLLVMLMLRLGNFRPWQGEGADPMLMIPLALAYAFAQVAIGKARKAPSGSPAAAASRQAVLVDATAIVDGRVADMVLVGLLGGPLVVPSSVRPMLEGQLKSKDMVQRGRARRGLETLERLEVAAGKSGGMEYRDFGEADREGFRILESLKREGSALLSADAPLLDTAAREGCRVIRLDEVGAATRAVLLPGERMRLKLVRKGRNQGQAVGYLPDGTMVVVEDGEEMMGRTVEAVAHTTFRASGGTMVFARATQMQEEEVPEAPAREETSAEDEVD
jgi:uncharacterized protein YacL